ncbi:hypothetical protein AGMMS49546_15780 [Spirochaetia bacterium]|nr:hypothetical protein AGMMS49546_15780 [Spirochaetia bacterium]
MTVMKIAESLEGTKFADNSELIGLIRKNLTAYNEAHLFDGGSDFNYRVSNDPHCEDKSHGEHWLVISFYQDHIIKPENGPL